MLMESVPTTTLEALVAGRQKLLARTHQLLKDGEVDRVGEQAEALPDVTRLLLVSLEELKVAEEELREQSQRSDERHAEAERELRHYRDLFQHIPLPAMVTDIYGTIIEMNVAAAELFRRQAKHLQRKPLAALIAVSARDEFRRQLGRVMEVEQKFRWRLLLQRTGDLPLEVHASVKRVPNLGPTSSGVLLWLFDPQTVDN